MLPTELLVTRIWEGSVKPKYATINNENIALAAELIRLYRDGVGLRKAELRERLSPLEESVPDYRFVRGLAALVERRCTFESASALEPVLVRRELFESSARRGFPTSEAARQSIIVEVAEKLQALPEQVESSMYADLEAEQILRDTLPIDPVQLLKEYNLSLSQTLLFHRTEMRFTASKNWQNIFRTVKKAWAYLHG